MDINRVIDNIIEKVNPSNEEYPDLRRKLAAESWELLKKKNTVK